MTERESVIETTGAEVLVPGSTCKLKVTAPGGGVVIPVGRAWIGLVVLLLIVTVVTADQDDPSVESLCVKWLSCPVTLTLGVFTRKVSPNLRCGFIEVDQDSVLFLCALRILVFDRDTTAAYVVSAAAKLPLSI